MIAGKIALLDFTTDEPLDSYGANYTAVDVRETYEYLDGSTVQHGLATGRVEGTEEQVNVTGSTIDVEQVGSFDRAVTEWVADVQDAGFIAAERTAGTDPMFPFDVFRSQVGGPVEPVRIDPPAFVDSREDIDLWFAGSKTETGENVPNDVSMGYGRDANQAGGSIGVGFKTSWNGTTARGVLYESGYVSVYNESWGPIQFAAFLRDAVLPYAEVPESEDEGTEQSTLEEDGQAECARCNNVRDLREFAGHTLCPICIDAIQDDEVDASLDDLQGGEAGA